MIMIFIPTGLLNFITLLSQSLGRFPRYLVILQYFSSTFPQIHTFLCYIP